MSKALVSLLTTTAFLHSLDNLTFTFVTLSKSLLLSTPLPSSSHTHTHNHTHTNTHTYTHNHIHIHTLPHKRSSQSLNNSARQTLGRSAGPAAAAVAALADERLSVAGKLLASGPLQSQLSLHHIHSGLLFRLPAAASAGRSGPQSLELGSCTQLEVDCSGSLSVVVGEWGHDVAGPMLGGWSV